MHKINPINPLTQLKTKRERQKVQNILKRALARPSEHLYIHIHILNVARICWTLFHILIQSQIVRKAFTYVSRRWRCSNTHVLVCIRAYVLCLCVNNISFCVVARRYCCCRCRFDLRREKGGECCKYEKKKNQKPIKSFTHLAGKICGCRPYFYHSIWPNSHIHCAFQLHLYCNPIWPWWLVRHSQWQLWQKYISIMAQRNVLSLSLPYRIRWHTYDAGLSFKSL